MSVVEKERIAAQDTVRKNINVFIAILGIALSIMSGAVGSYVQQAVMNKGVADHFQANDAAILVLQNNYNALNQKIDNNERTRYQEALIQAGTLGKIQSTVDRMDHWMTSDPFKK